MDVNFWPMGDRAEYEALRPHNMQLSTNVFSELQVISRLLSRLNDRIVQLKTDAQSAPSMPSKKDLHHKEGSVTMNPGVMHKAESQLSLKSTGQPSADCVHGSTSHNETFQNREFDFNEQRRLVQFYSSKVSLMNPDKKPKIVIEKFNNRIVIFIYTTW
uniref:Uncharacterized protein n=1 Tax=Schistocephalus solidus TaxID=70667 RepID=A0A0X3PYA4_SCHSO